MANERQQLLKRMGRRVCSLDTFLDLMVQPGDICLTQGRAFMSKAIRFGQALEDGGQPSYFNHVLGFTTTRGIIIESVRTIRENTFAKFYLNTPLLVLRHQGLTPELYDRGIKEVQDNLGMVYPAHRIAFHAVDMLWAHGWQMVTGRPWRKHMLARVATDWPVCSELWAQFVLAAGLPLGLELGERWQGVNPDHWFDALWVPGTQYKVVYAGRVLKKLPGKLDDTPVVDKG